MLFYIFYGYVFLGIVKIKMFCGTYCIFGKNSQKIIAAQISTNNVLIWHI